MIIREINAGFGSGEWGNIKMYKDPRSGTDPYPPYFFSGLSIPSPASPHASIVPFHGAIFMDGHEYVLKVVGVANVTDTLYAEVVFEVAE